MVNHCLQILLVTETEVDLERQQIQGDERSIPRTLYLHLSLHFTRAPVCKYFALSVFTVYQLVEMLLASLQWETTVRFPAWALLQDAGDTLECYRPCSWATECPLLCVLGKQNGGTALTTAPGHGVPYNMKSQCLNAGHCNQKRVAFTQTSDTLLNA